MISLDAEDAMVTHLQALVFQVRIEVLVALSQPDILEAIFQQVAVSEIMKKRTCHNVSSGIYGYFASFNVTLVYRNRAFNQGSVRNAVDI